MNKNYLVSICCITYNHEQFLAQAIESFLMQKTNFAFEIVIGEDCSTDNTAAIVKAYAQKYPDIIKARCNSKNMGANPNFIKTIQECTGKYIALCEGDDYWTDPDKLQKQVDYLEAHPEFVASGHETLRKIYVTDPPREITETDWLERKQQHYYSGEDIIQSAAPFHPSSLVFRNIIPFNDKKIQKIFTVTSNGDHALYAILGCLGNAYFFNETMSVYNLRGTGITATLFDDKQMIITFKKLIAAYNRINRYFKKKEDAALNELILKFFDKMMFNKSLYQNKFVLFCDCLLFVFTNRYGKKPFLAKGKYIIKTLLT